MLSFMREKAGSWVIKVVLIAIVVVFVFWGVGSFNDKKANQVASVNGESIEQDEFRRAYNNHIENLRRQFRDALTPEMIEKLQIKQQVVEGLINQKLLLQEAKKNNLRVTDQELVDSIQRIEAFKTAGTFDNSRYRAIMNQIRMAPELFEEGQRQDLLVNKMRAVISAGIHVPEAEARQWYEYKNASVTIDFVLFSPQSYKDIEPNESELKTFFEENKAAYKTDLRVKACYIQIDPDKFKGDVVLSEPEISDYYESFADEFRTEKTVDARHILVKVDEGASAEVVETARQKALAALKEAREGKSFDELAKKYSDGPTKDKGGYLGTFKRSVMVKPFADKAFSMEAGDISDPVRTTFGWHVIKVEKINEPSVRSLEDAAKDIREKLTNQKAREKAFNTAESVYDAAFVNGDLAKTAAGHKLELKTTDFFTKDGKPLQMKDAAQFARVTFDLADMAISNVQEFNQGYVILQRLESDPEKIPDLSTIQPAVRADVIKRKQEEAAKAAAESFLSVLKSGVDMTAEAKKINLNPVRTGFFKRDEKIPQIGLESEIARVAFELSKDKKLPDSTLQGKNGIYVIQFAERKSPDADGFAAEKKKIEENLQAQKTGVYFKQWLDKVRATGDIVIGETFQK